MKRSISMPVKPRYIEELPPLERSEEREELFENVNYSQKCFLSSDGSEFNPYEVIKDDEKSSIKHMLNDFRRNLNSSQPREPYSARVIAQSGQHNVTFFNIPGRSLKYFKDLMTTLIEQDWIYTLIIFLSTFFITWIIFTSLWYLIAYAHGDLNYDERTGEALIEGKQPCVIGAQTFTGLFIYTVETQVSIGFGEKYPSDECPEGVFLFVTQLIIYIGIEGAMVGIVFAKVARPSKQVSESKFSKKAVICQRDGRLCLVIRVWDQKGQQAIGTKIRVFLLEDKKSREGEHLGKCLQELSIEDSGTPFVLWPTTICHFIDRRSPFYKYCREEVADYEFEIIVTLTGSSSSTGQVTESRTSYLPKEIFWGECFVNIIHHNAFKNVYTIDNENFNSTVPVSMPRMDYSILNSKKPFNLHPRKKYSN